MSPALFRSAALIAALAVVSVLTGCAASTPTTTSSSSVTLPEDAGDVGEVEPTTATPTPDGIDVSTVDACAVLMQSDADTLAGTPLLAPVPAVNSSTSSCSYSGDPNGPTAQVEIYIGDGAKQQLEIDRDQLAHTFIQPTGIGEEAWQQDGVIFARTGETWVSIILVKLDDPALFVTPLQTAMSTALSRLAS